MIGMGTALISELRDAGREVHVWLSDVAPSGEGSRIAAFQLRQLDIPFTVIPDASVGWLMDQRDINAVLLRGDHMAVNGDCGTVIGGLSVALVAASSDVPVYVLAPRSAFDPAASDGKALRVDSPAAAGATRLNPTSDVIPARLITAVFTEGA
jgi:methylthioribose-1-phosphate isomerase